MVRHPKAQLLVLAGDIHQGCKAVELFENWGCPVIYVPGNHEYYGESFELARAALAKRCEGTNVHLLDDASLEFKGVRFLGSTMWTDYELFPTQPREQSMAAADHYLNDAKQIRCNTGRFDAEQALAEHKRSRQWLKAELLAPYCGKTVVVTHHGPHIGSIHPRWAGNAMSPAFASDLSELLPHADLWVHGHCHNSLSYTAMGCPVQANPAGYPRFFRTNKGAEVVLENPKFKRSLLLSLQSSSPAGQASLKRKTSPTSS